MFWPQTSFLTLKLGSFLFRCSDTNNSEKMEKLREKSECDDFFTEEAVAKETVSQDPNDLVAKAEGSGEVALTTALTTDEITHFRKWRR